jgi:polyferredoxin
MAASTSSSSPGSGQSQPHAGVTLDVGAIDHAALHGSPESLDHTHVHVEPIPWKTGAVGAVKPIDRATTWTPVAAASAAPAPAAPAPARAPAKKKDAAVMAAAEKASAAAIESALGIGLPGSGPKKKKIDPKLPGSGIPARKSIRTLVWIRRASQVGFFVLFMYFLFQTGFHGSFAAKSDTPVRLPLPVEAFLLADPFVSAMTVLSTHTVYRGLLWSVGLLGLTLVVGRVFCGWICPFGTLHHFFGWILPSRKGRGALRVEANKTHDRRQNVKYYLMYAFLLASVAGSAIGGLFDPICIAVRAIGLGVIPGAQYVAHRGLGAVQDVPFRPLQAAADHTQDALATAVWGSHQFYFHQTWLIVVLLVAILFMNRFVPRFWCRVLCPLGAFLGVFAKFALFGMEKDHAKCTDCNLCLVNCQGADSPQGGVKWRQDECHVCLNCETACPEDVIKFRFLPNRKSALSAPALQRRTLLATTAADRRFPRRELPREGDQAPGRGRGARLPRALHPLRRVHEGVPQQRAPSRAVRGRHRRSLDAHPHRAHRLLRALVRALRAGLPHRRHPEDHREGEARSRGAAREDRHGVLRPRALPALVHADSLHRLRGVLPDFSQGHLGRGGGSAGSR